MYGEGGFCKIKSFSKLCMKSAAHTHTHTRKSHQCLAQICMFFALDVEYVNFK